MSVRQRVSAISQRWFLVEPLLFAVWTTHDLVMEPKIHSIRVGRGRIECNPAFLETLDPRNLETVMRCEAVRILLKHPYQRRKPDGALSYLASNLTLQEALQTDLPWPRAQEIFGTHQYDNQYFEFYYQLLQEKAFAASPGDAAKGLENTRDWDADDLLGDRIDAQIRSAQHSASWGTVAGRLREQILANLNPQLDYRSILALFRKSVISTRRRLTRMKPSRRYGFQCMGSRYEFATRLLIAVDVSGSMDAKDLAHGFSVINRFFRYGVRSLDVICFDTQIQGQPLALSKARHRVEVTGRGGTDLGPVLDYIDEHREYDGLIVFTDGQAPIPRPPRNRGTRVLWLFNSEDMHRRYAAGLRAIGLSLYLKASPR